MGSAERTRCVVRLGERIREDDLGQAFLRRSEPHRRTRNCAAKPPVLFVYWPERKLLLVCSGGAERAAMKAEPLTDCDFQCDCSACLLVGMNHEARGFSVDHALAGGCVEERMS